MIKYRLPILVLVCPILHTLVVFFSAPTHLICRYDGAVNTVNCAELGVNGIIKNERVWYNTEKEKMICESVNYYLTCFGGGVAFYPGFSVAK